MNSSTHDTAIDRNPRQGAAMFLVVVGLSFLGLLGFTTFAVSRTDFRITSNATDTTRAFYQADSGVQFVRNQIEQDLAQGKTMNTIAGDMDVSAPEEMSFDPVVGMTQLTNTNLYSFTVTGRTRRASATIEAVVRQALALDLGVFGNQLLYMSPNVNIYTYYSDVISTPSPADSVGGGKSGSNEELIIRPNTTIDGHFVIGELANGDTGVYPTSHYVQEIDRIAQDPLGAAAGTVADLIDDAQAQNDNALVPAITGNMLDLVNHVTAIIPSGDYYLTDIDIGNHSILTVDASSGPVNLFLEGGFNSSPGCEINVIGDPKDFRIFSNANELIVVQPNNAFKAFIYAPFAEVRVFPGSNFYGIIWGRSVDLHPGGDVYIDLSMLETMYANRITIDSWKEVRR